MDISPLTLVGQAGTFLVLVLVTMKFVWPPLTKAMEDRRQKIAEGLAQSDEAEQALAIAQTQAEQVLREARSRSSEIIEQAGHRGNEIIEQAKQDALGERDRQVQAAEADIRLATNQAREALREKLAELTVAGASKVIGEELDADRHRAMLDKMAMEL